MPKRINYDNRTDGIVPHGDTSVLMHPDKMKEHFENIKDAKQRKRFVAFLHAFYSGPEIVRMLGVNKHYVVYASRENRETVDTAQASRNFAIANMTERRVIELLQKMNVDNIPDDKKAQSVKFLMDSSKMAGDKMRKETGDERESTMELVFKLTRRMAEKKESGSAPIIDINNEVEVTK